MLVYCSKREVYPKMNVVLLERLWIDLGVRVEVLTKDYVNLTQKTEDALKSKRYLEDLL